MNIAIKRLRKVPLLMIAWAQLKGWIKVIFLLIYFLTAFEDPDFFFWIIVQSERRQDSEQDIPDESVAEPVDSGSSLRAGSLNLSASCDLNPWPTVTWPSQMFLVCAPTSHASLILFCEGVVVTESIPQSQCWYDLGEVLGKLLVVWRVAACKVCFVWLLWIKSKLVYQQRLKLCIVWRHIFENDHFPLTSIINILQLAV